MPAFGSGATREPHESARGRLDSPPQEQTAGLARHAGAGTAPSGAGATLRLTCAFVDCAAVRVRRRGRGDGGSERANERRPESARRGGAREGHPITPGTTPVCNLRLQVIASDRPCVTKSSVRYIWRREPGHRQRNPRRMDSSS